MLQKIKLYQLVSIGKSLWKIQSPQSKRASIKLFFKMLMGSMVDIIGLSSILPVLALAQDPGLIHSNQYLNSVFNLVGLSENQFITALFLMLLPIFIFRAVVYLYVRYSLTKHATSFTRTVATKLFKSYLYKPFQFIIENNSSDLIRNVYFSSNQFSNFFLIPILQLMSEILVSMFILVVLAIANPIVFVFLVLTLGPTFFFFYSKTRKRMTAIGEEVFERSAVVLKQVKQGVSGYVDVKLSLKEDYFVENFNTNQKNIADLNVKRAVLVESFPRLAEFMAITGVVVIYIIASQFAEGSKQYILILLTFYAASAYRLMPSINKMVASLMLISEYKHLIELFSLKDEDGIHKQTKAIERKLVLEDSISLEGVSFDYDNSGFNLKIDELTINKGDMIGVVGESGSGKSTFINLLLGFYKPNEGEIYKDNDREMNVNMTEWKSLFGYVKQDLFISDASIKENIAFGVLDGNINETKVWDCLEKALLKDFVAGLPDGIDTVIGEEGGFLSGGQKQRIGIARSLYREAQVLIFDEATSALDKKTEKEITDSIFQLSQQGVTIVMVSHNAQPLKYCNFILKFAKGRFEKVKA